jgi:hypothetical protein
LHLHKNGTTTPWFSTTLTGSTNNPDDCYYINCKASSFGTHANWNLTSSPLSECEGGPEGTTWQGIGSCYNPRLDIDNISQPGIPENINVDNPVDSGIYRVMVHFYGGFAVTHPLVNIYCGGTLLGTYGQAPDQVQNFNTGGGYGGGLMWRVVDVTTHVAGGTTTGCDLAPLHPPGSSTGYYVTTGNRAY